MTVALSISAVVLGGSALLLWALWRWATGHALIAHRDILERRNT
ncbi:hypothetical protein ABH922_002980 [Rhodococcus sp. 27YEA15]